MSLLATRKAVGLLISTLGLTKTGELTADSLTVKLPNCTPPTSNSTCANHRLSRDCSFIVENAPPFFLFFLRFVEGRLSILFFANKDWPHQVYHTSRP